jgi:hypothetical protein
MSSTNRGYDRHKSDYYITPIEPIKEMLNDFLLDERIERPDKMLWLDPCSGGDDKHEMSYPKVIQEEFDADVMTLDIRKDSRAEVKADYLEYEIKDPKPDVIITNPPFNLAEPIIRKALQDVKDGGYVIMLLRLNFWGCKAREPLFNEYPPKYCYIHPRRMSFTQDKKTDSIEYAHFVWQQGYFPTHTKTVRL